MRPLFAQAQGGARRAAMPFIRGRLLSVAALIPLAPTFQAAGRLAEHASERAAARPAAVFPLLGRPDWGEADARFGAYRGGHMHEGQDVFARAGTPLVAVRDGRVVETGDDPRYPASAGQGAGGGRGNYVAIWSRDARSTFVYLHMLRPVRLDPGDRVRMGQRVGAVGCTGSCWGDHLHFELRRGRGTTGRPHDPMPLLKRLSARRGERE
jgi:murein DD-endopeptidase MepM/ murein hydrolase activator NlpD